MPAVVPALPAPLHNGQATFWLIMTIITAVICVIYFLISKGLINIPMSSGRRHKFDRSAWLLLAWAALCFGHYLLMTK